ncbi:hypothetical protein KJ966_18310 [bacterium]|nr:hypothetical protein [bacterium]
MSIKQTVLSIDFLKESVQRKFSVPGSMDKKTIGLELELLPFREAEGESIQVADIINERMRGSYDLLYSNSLCQCSLFEQDKKLDVPRLNSKSGGIITFEPGGQVEYSSSAQPDLGKVINELILNVSELEQILAKEKIRFFFGGMNPWQSVEEVGLKMRKPRYIAMDNYFKQIGAHGQQMMRLSASIQVNLDFGCPEIAEKRWKAANLLSPIFCAIFGNTPFHAGMPTGLKSYRTLIWQNLDASRAGFPHLAVERNRVFSCVKQYLEFALNASVFTLPKQCGCLGYCENNISFRRWLEQGYNGYYPTIEDWEVHLTTLFPDVRPKGFLEIRFIDGQSKPCWAVPAILSTAIIYDEKSTEKVIDLLSPFTGELDKMATKALKTGVDAFPELCREIFNIGMNSQEYKIEDELLGYCERFYQRYTAKSRNPADDLLEINNQSVFSLRQYEDFESRLFEEIQPPRFVATKNAKDLASGCIC